jgi:hypothetical protein
MMKMIRWIAPALFATALAACGGGGGSAGTTATGGGSGSGSGSTPSATPTLVLSLIDASGSTISNHSVPSGSITYAKAVVTDSTGAKVANKLVAFSSGSNLLTFSPASGQVLTDGTGAAKVLISPASLSTSGAGTLSASAIIGSQTLSDTIDIQTSPAQVALANLASSQATLTAFQSAGVSVDVSVNGQSAGSIPITVNFAASCGAFSPASTTSNSSAKATSTFTATGCTGGAVTLTASAVGAAPVQTSVNVQAPTPTNLLFVSATPPTIYTSLAAFGVKQSTVVFKVVDASGAPITSPTDVKVSLSTASIASGVVFADTNTTTPKIVSTDSNGLVSVIVKSGSVPTPLALTAQLVSNSVITASSAGLSVNSGRPSQAFFSMSAESFNIEGAEHDGVTDAITILVADRLGQPVPAGTPVSFITEGGQIAASCQLTIDSNNHSGCTVSFISQAFRPANNRVTILAYAEGEEVFVDANGNNQYDPGETFYDMGQPFLDTTEGGTFTAGDQKIGDPSVPGAGIGTAACPPHQFQIATVANTCDGAWGPTLVRQNIVVAFSSHYAAATTFNVVSGTEVDFTLADVYGNAMPAKTVITATVSGGTGCGLDQIIPSTVPSTPNPTHHAILLTATGTGATCSGALINVKATTPIGVQNFLGTVTMP